jgi:hypothetical protein
MPTMPTMPTKKPTYADVLKKPWSPKEELEEKRHHHVCLLDVLEELLEAVPASCKLIDDASDDESSCFSYLTYDFDPPLRRGLIVDEEEEEGPWDDFTWGYKNKFTF